MKKLSLLFLSLFIIGLIFSPAVFGATTGDFQSAASGNWGDLTTWQTWNGSSWIAASTTPDSTTSAVVTILSPHNVTVAALVAVRNVTVNSGATVTVNGTPVVLYITNEGMLVNGTLILVGDVATAAPYSVAKTTGTLTIGNGGVVNYNQYTAASSTKGALPTATWSTGSTLNVNATGGATCSNWGGGGSQDFYNINWNFPTQTANFGFGLVGNTIGGTVNIISTGTGRFMFFGGTGGAVKINGDFIVSGSASATIMGSGNGVFDTASIYGKVNVNTTGNFSITRGSQASGTGTSIWYFYGDSIKIRAKIMQNSNSGTDVTKFIFKKSGTQYLSITPDSLNSNATPIEVSTGTTVTLISPVNCTRLYLNGGIIVSSSSNPLIMGWWTSSTSSLTSGSVSPTAPGNSSSYVSGPMTYLYATAAGSTTKDYPIGKGGIYRPLSFSFTQTAATLSTYTAELFNSPPAPPSNTLAGTLQSVSSVRYYTISEAPGGSAFTSGSLKLSYGTDDGVTDSTILRIARGPSAGGGAWVDLGGTGNGSPTGTITSPSTITDLTNNAFILAKSTVRLLSLTAFLEGYTNVGGTAMLYAPAAVTVELHNATTPHALVESKTGPLSTAGVGTFSFSTAVNSTPYYIVVKSWNTIETWSAAAHSFVAGALSYNFTTPAGQSYGPNMIQKGTHYCAYSGDVSQDGQVTFTDLIAVDNDNTNFVTGNTNTDLTGDGQVTFSDLIIVDNNNSNFIAKVVPTGAPSAIRVNRPIKVKTQQQ